MRRERIEEERGRSSSTRRSERRSSATGSNTPSDGIASLQRRLGNQALRRAVEDEAVPTRSGHGRSARDAEREAERVAERVARTAAFDAADSTPERGPEFEPVRPGGLGTRNRLASGSGSPLPRSVRSALEPQFGVGLGNVRVHDGTDAARMAGLIRARAFTHGTDIYFDRGEFDVDTLDGRRLLAHELTHVVQQARTGRAAVTGDATTASRTNAPTDPRAFSARGPRIDRDAETGARPGVRPEHQIGPKTRELWNWRLQAIHTLERDIEGDPEPSTIGVSILKGVAETAINVATSGISREITQALVRGGGALAASELSGAVVDDVIAATMQTGRVRSNVDDAVAETGLGRVSVDPLTDFLSIQRLTIESMKSEAESQASARRERLLDSPGGDLVLAELVRELDERRGTAFKTQYVTSLGQWLRIAPTSIFRGFEGLKLDVAAAGPDSPRVRVRNAELSQISVSRDVIDRIGGLDTPLERLQVPMRVEARIGSAYYEFHFDAGEATYDITAVDSSGLETLNSYVNTVEGREIRHSPGNELGLAIRFYYQVLAPLSLEDLGVSAD
jgi:hypothetical protein